MSIRTALSADIPAMHRIRRSVSQNQLVDLNSVTEETYQPYVAASSAWVAEIDGVIRGFGVVDARDRSVWALFVDPDAEGQGFGRALHDHILKWSRGHQFDRLLLTTAPGTRAEQFYRSIGWSDAGIAPNGDLRFEKLL